MVGVAQVSAQYLYTTIVMLPSIFALLADITYATNIWVRMPMNSVCWVMFSQVCSNLPQ